MGQDVGIQRQALSQSAAPVSDVLCVDLDGTFLRTDSLYEALVAAIKARPMLILFLPFWILKRPYSLKEAITNAVKGKIDPSTWPRTPEVERLIARARASGKTVELVSAADQRLIADVPSFREFFDGIIGSSKGVNLKGEAKAEFLRSRHSNGFAYVGNSMADLPVWRAATERYAVNPSPLLRRRAARDGIELVELTPPSPILPPLLKSLRLHQWLKNLIVLVPLGLLGPRATLGNVLAFLIGFLLFGLLTSGTYLVNDILDIDADRRHRRGSRRR